VFLYGTEKGSKDYPLETKLEAIRLWE
jgi:hypothetical protein